MIVDLSTEAMFWARCRSTRGIKIPSALAEVPVGLIDLISNVD